MQNESLLKALKRRNQAIYDLAKIMARDKAQYGRQAIEKTTLLPLSVINNLCWLGNLSIPFDTLILPEALFELRGQTNRSIRRFIKQVKKHHLTPSQLRQLIRAQCKTIVSKRENIKVSKLPKLTMLLQNELKQMTPDNRARAVEHIKASLQ